MNFTTRILFSSYSDAPRFVQGASRLLRTTWQMIWWLKKRNAPYRNKKRASPWLVSYLHNQQHFRFVAPRTQVLPTPCLLAGNGVASVASQVQQQLLHRIVQP